MNCQNLLYCIQDDKDDVKGKVAVTIEGDKKKEDEGKTKEQEKEGNTTTKVYQFIRLTCTFGVNLGQHQH